MPSFQVISQAIPTADLSYLLSCSLACTGDPFNPGAVSGHTYTYLSLSAAPCLISLGWKRWNDVTPLPCVSRGDS